MNFMSATRSFRLSAVAVVSFLGIFPDPSRAAPEVDADPLVYHMAGAHRSEANVAYGKKVTLGAGTVFNGEDPQQLVNSSGSDGALSVTSGSNEPVSFTVDLGRPHDITSIRVMTHFSGDEGTWAGRAKILVSDNGQSFKLLADRLSGCRVIGTPWDTTLQNYRTHTRGGTTVIQGNLDRLHVAKGVRYVRMELPNSNLVTDKTHIRMKPWSTLFTKRWVVNGIQIGTDAAGAGLVVPRARGEVSFDAALSSWKSVPGLVMNRRSQFRSDKWQGPDQLSGVVKLTADHRNLYVAADVTQDGSPVNERVGSESIYQDSVALFLNLQDLRNVSRIDYNAQICELAWSGTETESGFEYQVVLNPASEEIWFMKRTSGLGQIERARVRGTNGARAEGGVVRVFNKPDGKGYVIVAAIPLSNFGTASLSSGMQIGVDASIRSRATGKLVAMTYQTGNPEVETDGWARAFLFERQASPSGGQRAIIDVDADTVRSFNGHDTIVRETFGIQPNESLSKPMRGIWQRESGSFGRVYLSIEYAWSGWVFGELVDKSEEEKRALIYDPEFWKRVDMDRVAPNWAIFRYLAEVQPENLFILLSGRAVQLEAEPVFGTRPPSLTPEQQALVARTGWKAPIEHLLRMVGEEDASPLINKDRDLQAELVVNIIARIREMMPHTRISITLANETNGLHNHATKKIMDDVFTSLEKHGNYRAGRVAAEEWLSLYNVLYKKMKARLPEVLLGGPDVIGVHFTWEEAGRHSWNDYILPILDGVVGMDFYDFHYAVNPETVQTFLELTGQYMRQKRGWSVRSVDSESGTLTWHKGSASVTQYMNTLKNQQEWFAYLRNPDLTFGWAPIDMPSYYDGFGQAKIPALGREMFMSLRGKYIDVETDSPDIETVASLDGNKVVCVALNNRGKHRDVELKVAAPANARFQEVHARMIWFDPRAERARYATFDPVRVAKADGLRVQTTVPPFGTCTVECILDKIGAPRRVGALRRHIADKTTVWVDGDDPRTFRVEIPPEDLTGEKRYLLRVAYEGTVYHQSSGYLGVRWKNAQVTINDKVSHDLPVYRKTNGYGRCHSIELELDQGILEPSNDVVFSTKNGGQKFMAILVSILVQDRVPDVRAQKVETVRLDRSSQKCTLTEEPSRTLPSGYARAGDPVAEVLEPVASWSFDSRKGQRVPDVSGNGHHGELLNGASLVEGRKGQALQVGNGACMKVESPGLLQTKKDGSFAISLWFKASEAFSNGALLQKATRRREVVAPWGTRYVHAPRETQLVQLAVRLAGGEWGTDFPVPSLSFVYSSPIYVMKSHAKTDRDVADGVWHHVVAVKDGSEHIAVIYVDGKYAGSGPGWIGADFVFGDPLYFGVAEGESFSDSFDGLIDEVAIYDKLLLPGDVERLYQRGGL